MSHWNQNGLSSFHFENVFLGCSGLKNSGFPGSRISGFYFWISRFLDLTRLGGGQGGAGGQTGGRADGRTGGHLGFPPTERKVMAMVTFLVERLATSACGDIGSGSQ